MWYSVKQTHRYKITFGRSFRPLENCILLAFVKCLSTVYFARLMFSFTSMQKKKNISLFIHFPLLGYSQSVSQNIDSLTVIRDVAFIYHLQ